MRRFLSAALFAASAAGLLAQPPDPPATLPPPNPLPAAAPVVVVPAGVEPKLDLVEFRDLPLVDAMRALSDQSGLKVVVSEQAAKKTVSLFLRDVPPMTAVAAVAQAYGLVYRFDPQLGLVRVFTPQENQRDLKDFRDEQTKVFTLLYPNAVNVASSVADLFGDRVQLSLGPNEFQTLNDLQLRFSRFDLINSRSQGLGTSIGGLGGVGGFGGGLGGFGGGLGGFNGIGGGLGGGLGGLGGGLGGFGGGLGGGLGGFGGGIGGGAFGGLGGYGGFGGFGGFGGLGGNLNRNQQQNRQPDTSDRPANRLEDLTPEEIQELQLLGGFDPSRPLTDADTARLLARVRRTTDIFVSVVRPNNQLMVRTSDPQALAQICDLVARLDVPTPTVLLEVKVLKLDLRDEFKSVFDYQWTDGFLTAGGFTTGDILPPLLDTLGTRDRRYGPITPPTLAGTPGNSRDLVFQAVSANFRARIQLLEDKGRVTELATPLLMTANNEVSQIFSGQFVPITVGFSQAQAVASGLGTGVVAQPTPQTTYQQIGTTLLITPNINADRTVTMRLAQQQSRVVPNGATIPVPNANGVGVSQVPVDTVASQNFTGTVIAGDGLTIAVGGLIDETLSDSRQEVPVLGRIPYVGFFFRRQLSERRRQELVILIRPFILNSPCEAKDASKLLVDRLSLNPVGSDPNTLGTHTPIEVLVPNPPVNKHQQTFRVHTFTPKDY